MLDQRDQHRIEDPRLIAGSGLAGQLKVGEVAQIHVPQNLVRQILAAYRDAIRRTETDIRTNHCCLACHGSVSENALNQSGVQLQAAISALPLLNTI